MNLRRWDVVFVRADERDEVGHPAVVLSHEDLLADDRFQRVNVVMGSKKPPAANLAPRQVMLNGADGLEFPIAVDCALVLVARKRGDPLAGRFGGGRAAPGNPAQGAGLSRARLRGIVWLKTRLTHDPGRAIVRACPRQHFAPPNGLRVNLARGSRGGP